VGQAVEPGVPLWPFLDKGGAVRVLVLIRPAYNVLPTITLDWGYDRRSYGGVGFLRCIKKTHDRPKVCEKGAEMRQIQCLVVCTVTLVMTAGAEAQTKFSGACNLGKPDPNYTVTVGDRPGHAMELVKLKCMWTKGELGGVALKEEDDTATIDVSGNTSRYRGYAVGTTVDGDKYFGPFEGTMIYDKNVLVKDTCTWKFSGGTGKLKGLKGNGTCTAKFDATGAEVLDVKGEYQLGEAKAK